MALLLAIFVLLLVAVVGIAMMAASGTETSLAGNYRSSTAGYYAALSGLEEGRGRLLPRPSNPAYLGNTSPAAVPPIGTNIPLGRAVYIRNIVAGDTPDPVNLGSAYPDTEYQKEFGSATPSSYQYVNSWPSFAGSPNASYKWVRINALTEQAINVDVNNLPGDYSGALNQTQIIRFDGTNLTRNAAPYQALGITALAALPDGSRKLLQYIVGPIPLQIPVTSALTLAGPGTVTNVVTFTPPASGANFYINGVDQCGSQPTLPGVGLLNRNDDISVSGTLSAPPAVPGHYTGAGGATPNITHGPPYPIPSNSTVDMTDPVSLSNLLSLAKQNADTVLNGPRTEADMPSGMNALNPMMVYVDGDLSLTGYTGYGLLVVHGSLTHTGDSGWRGVVIVLGGTMEGTGSATGGEFDGAVYVANLSPAGTSLGMPTFIASPSGNGIHYNSCLVSTAQKIIQYKVLAFRELPYP